MLTLSVSDVIALSGALASLLTVAMRRFGPAQKRLGWRVQMDRPIRMMPEVARGLVDLRLFRDGREVPDATLALVRVENAGPSDISQHDIHGHLSVVFEDRTVLAAKVDEVSNDGIRTTLTTDGLTTEGGDTLKLPRVPLNRRDHFKVLVLLTGAGSKVTLRGFIHGGRIVQGHGRRRTLVMSASLLTVLAVCVTLFVVSAAIPNRGNGEDLCSSGRLTVDGSTAFESVMTQIKNEYTEECPEASIEIEGSGSLEGVRNLTDLAEDDPTEAKKYIAVSDGPTSESSTVLVPTPVGVVIFAVVVNKDAGIDSLTVADLRRIYEGEITNWSELGGADESISIVSRGGESGTRRTFEANVLGQSEPGLTSDDCETPLYDGSDSSVIRCERSATDELMDEVNHVSGAIGYAELSVANTYDNVTTVKLDGYSADIATVETGDYPFWTVETLYTYGEPEEGSLTKAFLNYLSEDTAQNILREHENEPCWDAQGRMNDLCRTS